MVNNIIAVFGLCGTGKSEFSNIAESEFKYKKVYFGSATFDYMSEHNIKVTPENERIVREKLRVEYGKGCYAKLALPKIKKYLDAGEKVIIESLYSWTELKIILAEYPELKTISLFVPKKLRYSRLAIRSYRSMTEVQVKDRDFTEIENLEKGGPIASSDYLIINDVDLNEFKSKVRKLLSKI